MRRVRLKLSIWGLTAILSIALLFLLSGCESVDEFNADELFSLEDMPRDYDFALTLIEMMDRWRTNIDFVVPNMGANINAVPFSDIIPEGWSKYEFQVAYEDSISWADPETTLEIPGAEESFDSEYNNLISAPAYNNSELLSTSFVDTVYNYGDTLFTHYYRKTFYTWYEEYYYKSFQDAKFEYLRFDFGLDSDSDIAPRQIEYQNFNQLATIEEEIPQINTGDSLVVRYADDYQNFSELSAGGNFVSIRLVYWTQGSGDFARSAGLFSNWTAEVTGLSPVPGDPRGEFEISGVSTVNDLANAVNLNVSASVLIRPNSTGESTIKVNGKVRSKIVFESYDSEFHGYFTMLEDNFAVKYSF